MQSEYQLLLGNSVDVLKTLEPNSVDCCITSPPYYALRDYGTGHWEGGDPQCPHYRTSKRSDATATGHKNMVDAGNPVGDAIYKTVCPLCGAVRVDEQIGLEETPEEYIGRLTEVFREVHRVLKDEGTLWVNIGDSYASQTPNNRNFLYDDGRGGNNGSITRCDFAKSGVKTKDLIGIPWMLAFALRQDGWYLRQDIIWAKPNPMPESVKDRCTKSHEYIFLLSKSPKYYYDSDAIAEDAFTEPTLRDKNAEGYQADYAGGERFSPGARVYGEDGKRNKRDVWNVPVGTGYKDDEGAHYATYSPKLIEPCVMAGCPEGGTVLDPFNGTATTGVVAVRNGRNYIGIDLSEKYIALSEKRLDAETAQYTLW